MTLSGFSFVSSIASPSLESCELGDESATTIGAGLAKSGTLVVLRQVHISSFLGGPGYRVAHAEAIAGPICSPFMCMQPEGHFSRKGPLKLYKGLKYGCEFRLGGNVIFEKDGTDADRTRSVF